MMKTSFALLLLGLTVAPAPQDKSFVVQDKKRGAKNKEVQMKYHALMVENGKENKAIKKDLEEKKGDAAIKARLATIKKNAEAASKLDYLKGAEEEVESFKSMFEIFIDIRLKTLLEETWNEANGEKQYERLQAACRTCHELFRDE